MNPPPARLLMTNVRKAFGATQALKGVNLEVAPGEIHALIGENGAGKSTLMKILSGACRADGGEITLDGRPFLPVDPWHARRSGIAMIYQELNLARHLTVEQNINLGEEPACAGWVNTHRARTLATEALALLQHSAIPLDAPVGGLSIAEQQVVEIARALVREPQVLIMDEPTSSLTQQDVAHLFAIIRRLSARGVSVIYISHFLEECQQICSRFTVLRDGETAGAGNMRDTTFADIIRLMVGRPIEETYPRTPHALGAPVLELRGLSGMRKPRDVSFRLHEGEILGIAGLIGAGRTETLRVTFGLDRLQRGELCVFGRAERRPTPARQLRAGIGFASENRKEEGLMLQRSLADNLTLTRYAPVTRAGFVRTRLHEQAAQRWMTKLNIRATHAGQPVAQLSGGNQQKVAVGRLLYHEAKILLLDEPTRGIDVGSKVQIYGLIGELAAERRSVIFVSSYLPELLGICDTIAVFCRGELVALAPVERWTEHTIIAAATGTGTQDEIPTVS